MIVRVWRGEATSDSAEAHQHHMTAHGVRALANIPGHRAAYLLRRPTDGHVEFPAPTLWDSIDAIKRFAGADPTAAVVEPEARAVLSDFDEFVRHYDLAFGSPFTTVKSPLT
jgi:heme-degrading monooxygenase HmoA